MIKPDEIIIKAVAHWNRYIFNPSWIDKFIVKKLFPEIKDIAISGNIMERDFIYEFNKISLIPKANLLEIRLNQDGLLDEDFEKRINLLFLTFMEILNLLPHTPVTAIGINIDYFLNKDKKCGLLNIFETNSQNKFEKFDLTQMRLSKTEENYILNLILILESNKVKANFNYHFNPPFNFENINILNLIELCNNYLAKQL